MYHHISQRYQKDGLNIECQWNCYTGLYNQKSLHGTKVKGRGNETKPLAAPKWLRSQRFSCYFGPPQNIYTFWVTINMDANVRAAYYRCQRQTFDQVGPLYIVWSLGQVVDDFVHYQGWMSKNCTPSRWNTWRRDLGNGVVRASRRHHRTRMRHPTLVGCFACWFGLRFGVQAHGVLRWPLKAFHLFYFLPPTCSEIMFSKRNANL